MKTYTKTVIYYIVGEHKETKYITILTFNNLPTIMFEVYYKLCLNGVFCNDPVAYISNKRRAVSKCV